MLNAEEIVRLRKPSPPASARLYAYVATAYFEAVQNGGAARAGRAAAHVLIALSPDDRQLVEARARALGIDDLALDPAGRAIVDRLVERAERDGADREPNADKSLPVGPGQWVSLNGQVPLGVTAGSWERWLVAGEQFVVPPPPAPDSSEMRAQLQKVRDAVVGRDARWVAAINYWGGVPGTEAPAGIWQNHLWKNVTDLAIARDDSGYAMLQTVLAQTIADAFMEAWKVKYRFWTARPDMVDPSIRVSMADPPFPGYVSGHSTISAAAAVVLSALLPGKSEIWKRSAEEARDSRLYAGIHLDVDNQVGFELGTAVGQVAAVSASNLVPRGVATVWVDQRNDFAYVDPVLTSAAPVELGRGEMEVVGVAGYDGGTSGQLYRISNPKYSRAFLVATGDQIGRLNPGWSATVLNRDNAWLTGECASNPSTVVGGRYEVFSDYVDGPTPSQRLAVFDTRTRRWATMSAAPDRAFMMLASAGSDTLSVVTRSDAEPQLEAWYIDVRDGSYVRRSIPDMPPVWYRASDNAQVAWRYVKLVDGVFRATTRDATVDGVVQPVPDSLDPGTTELVYLDSAKAVKARIFAWRNPQALGWDGDFGYFAADQTNPTDGPTVHGPGVYNTRTTTWDWALSAVLPSGSVDLGLVN